MVEDIEKADEKRVQKLSYILGIGNGKLEEIISYKQLVDHLEAAAHEDSEIRDDLFNFRALIGHQGPLKPTDPSWKGCKYNVLVDWETGEKTFEPLSVLAADDPVTCASYAKENDLLHVDRWKRFRNLAKRDKTLTRAIMQSKIRQARRSNKYMFECLIPRSYKEALEFHKENNNTKWADATRDEMDSIKEQEVSTKSQKAKWDDNHKSNRGLNSARITPTERYVINWLLPGNSGGRSVNNSTTKIDIVKRLSKLNNQTKVDWTNTRDGL